MNKGLNRKVIAIEDDTPSLTPSDMESLREQVARGYRHACRNHPELPPCNDDMKTMITNSVKLTRAKKKHYEDEQDSSIN